MASLRKITIRLAMLVGLVGVATLAVLAYHLLSTPQRVALVVPSVTATRISFFALGDQGAGWLDQWSVARSMEKVAEETGSLDFVVLLGDNFYNDGIQSTDDRQWNWKFENMYSGTKLATIPFYAVLGNHDVQVYGEAQIEYSRKQLGSGRWQMPGHYYSRDFGMDNGHPLLRVVFIDSNVLTPEGMAKQLHFIEESFAPSASQATWRIVAAHHPIRNFGKHGETPELLSALLPILKKSHVDLYMAGHDHNQQLIVRDGEPYYVISGAGGKSLYPLARDQQGLLFGRSQYGFARTVVDSSRMVINFYDDDAQLAAAYGVDRSCKEFATACLKQTVAPTTEK